MTHATKYLLLFDHVTQVIEEGFAQLPATMSCPINTEQYVIYLLEWLSVKIEDPQATTAADLAIAYMASHGVPDQFAREMSHFVLETILFTVIGAFPDITYLELSRARYVMEDYRTLAVYLPPPTPCESSLLTRSA